MRSLLSCFEALAVQSETYGDRLKVLGAPVDRVVVTGNIKFDQVESDRDNAKTRELRTSFNLDPSEIVLIAGSTQAPEESYALDTWLALRSEFPMLRLILVPRHKERFDEVAELIQQRGCSLVRRSQQKLAGSTNEMLPATDFVKAPAVLLLDTLGELAACWGLADIAFVGGSLTNRGGQNMIEPAGYGAAVLFGPNTWNFKDVTEALLARQAARVVTGPEELLNTVRHLLRHREDAKLMGQAAREFVATQQGATQRSIDLISKALENRNG